MPSYPYDQDEHPRLYEASEQGRKAARDGKSLDELDVDGLDQDQLVALLQGHAHYTLTSKSW